MTIQNVGYAVSKQELDQQAGGIVERLRNTLDHIARFQANLSTYTDSDLLGLGYSQAEVDFLQACFIDLENMRLTIIGQRAQSPASNFLFNAGKLTGTR